MLHRFARNLTVLLSLAGATAPVAAQQAPHPLAALSGAEVAKAVRVLDQAGRAGAGTYFPGMALEEPPKAEVLAWRPGQPFTRRAQVTLRRDAKSAEAVVDLDAGKVLSYTPLPGIQPSIMQHEYDSARALTKADPRWRAAMKRRGYTSLEAISCTPLLPGRFPGEITARRRILKVLCYDTARPVSRYTGRPIEGVVAIVDVDGGKVVSLIDRDIVSPPASATHKAASGGPAFRAPLNPVLNLSPLGRNVKITRGWQVAWQNWSFQFRVERQVGPILSLVKFRDQGTDHMIAYQMSLGDMFVPYMDPDPTWSFRTFMDAGEYGVGYLASSLMPGRDCPLQSAFITIAIPSDKGGVFAIKRGVCIFERATGEPIWRHRNPDTKVIDSRPNVELVFRMITTVGNYDYALDWVFSLDGNIRIRVGAFGYLAVKTVKNEKVTGNPASDPAHGTLVAPGVLGVYHEHYFSFRLDLDVEGAANTLMLDSIVPKRLPDPSPRRSLWVVRSKPMKTEGPVADQADPVMWRVINPNRRTALGHHPGIHIMPGHQARSLLSPDDPPQGRAAYSAQKLWVSRYRPNERYPAGRYPNQSKPGQGLTRFVADRQSIENADLVFWYTAGFHHVTRVEDWPIMPAMWLEFTLRPFNMLARNPSTDLAPDFRRAR